MYHVQINKFFEGKIMEKKIKSFNKQNLDEIAKAINKSLDEVGKTYGIEIELGRCTYAESYFSGKLEANLEAKDGEIYTKEAIAYQKYCRSYGLDDDWFNQEFTHNYEIFKIVGLCMKAKKYPVICQKMKNNKSYKFPVDLIRKEFEPEVFNT